MTDRWADQGPGFNRAAANAVYATVSKMDADEAAMFTRIIADAVLQDDLMVHGEVIAKTLDAHYAARAEVLKKHLARTVIAKTRNGEDATPELAVLDTITKSWLGEKFGHAARSRRAKERQRGLGNGQFVAETHDIDTTNTVPHSVHHGVTIGIPPAPEDWGPLSDEETAAYQDAYHQVSALIAPFRRMPKDSAFVHVHTNDGKATIERIDPKADLPTAPFDPRGGKRVTQMKTSVIPPSTAQGAIYSLLDAIGMPVTGAVAAGATKGGALDPARLRQYQAETKAPTNANDEFAPSSKVFRQLGASSKLIGNTLGDVAPPPAKMALELAQHVGGLGPVVQQVVGPTVDRAAYRYRGTERAVDPKLHAQIGADETTARRTSTKGAVAARNLRDAELTHANRLRGNQSVHDERVRNATEDWERAGRQYKFGTIDRDGLKGRAKAATNEINTARDNLKTSNKKAHETHKAALAQHEMDAKQGQQDLVTEHGKLMAHGRQVRGGKGWQPSQTLGYMKDLLPKPGLNNLHLAAGNVPPSQGIILDANNKVISQAVGYGDDHYLPFNLRGMKKMNGGSYIRTRSWGGPTPEDIRSGLISGAHRLTVVSNNGVFVVNFDDTFKGGRRHNDKAHRMIGRYEHLLDAVKGGKVARAGISPDRLADLKTEAATFARPDYNAAGYARKLSELEAQERADPKMSTAQRNEAAADYIAGLAADQSAKGGDITSDQLVGELATKAARVKQTEAIAARKAMISQYPEMDVTNLPPQASLETLRQGELDRIRGTGVVDTAANVAAAMGDTVGFTSFMGVKERDAKSQARDLQLDGPGYEAALDALQEEFPYYIASTEFRPWGEGGEHKKDSGYVRPGSLRPAQAQAGFFNSDISGGKVRADTIRGQGGNAAPKKVGVADPDRVITTAQRPAGAPPWDEDAPVSQGAPAGAPNVMAARRKVDHDMIDALLAQTHFGPNAVAPEPNWRINHSVPNFPEELKFVYGPGVTAGKLKIALAREPANRDKIAAAVTWMQNNNSFPADAAHAEIVRRFQSSGEPAAPVDDPGTAGVLKNIDGEYNFAHLLGGAYVPGGGRSSAEIGAAYDKDGMVATLRANDELADTLTAPDFTTKADALQATLTQDQDDLDLFKVLGSVGAPPVDPVAHERRVHGLVHAKTLRRRLSEAGDDEAAAQAQRQRDLQMAQAGAAIDQHILKIQASPAEVEAMAKDPDAARQFDANLAILVERHRVAELAEAQRNAAP